MKVNLFLLPLFILFSHNTFSQCTYSLYPSYVKIQSAQTITALNTWYWVCENVVLTVDSSQAGTFFMEQNSKIIFSKASMSCDAVYAKNNCTVTNNSAGCVAVTASTVGVVVQNTGSGSASIGFTCGVMSYNYSQVGGAPCIGTTGIHENSANADEFVVYPNPIDYSGKINLRGSGEIKNIHLIDLNGAIVSSTSDREMLIKDIPPGFYILEITTSKGVTKKKISVVR